MRYGRVHLEAMAYELAPIVVTSEELEERVAPMYEALRLRPGQLEALTGIRERRWWPPGFLPSQGGVRAARKALAASRVSADQIGILIHAGVCRDNLEPATACAVAAELGLSSDVEIYDLSNACLGVMNAILTIANRIELGQVRAGMVVTCESAREINEVMIAEMNASPDMEMFKMSLATLTGGSGAVAIILTAPDLAPDRPRLLGGVMRAAPEHHALCRWGADRRANPRAAQWFETDAVAVQRGGIALGMETWHAFLAEMDWTAPGIDRVITHQVSGQHRAEILRALGIDPAREFPTYAHLGNMGTAALPSAAAIAAERGFLTRGDRVAWLGIGSGLNCLMLGWEW